MTPSLPVRLTWHATRRGERHAEFPEDGRRAALHRRRRGLGCIGPTPAGHRRHVRERAHLRRHGEEALGTGQRAGRGQRHPDHFHAADPGARRHHAHPRGRRRTHADARPDRQPRTCAAQYHQPGGTARSQDHARNAAGAGDGRGGADAAARFHGSARHGRADADCATGDRPGRAARPAHLRAGR